MTNEKNTIGTVSINYAKNIGRDIITDYSWLYITNITKHPIDHLINNVVSSIFSEDFGNIITKEETENIFSSLDFILENFEENGKVCDIQSFVDNLLINFDYLAFIKGETEK